jgi:hypothetical protein
MTTITVQAVYRNGVLFPGSQLNLPDNTPLQVQITLLPSPNTPAPSLFGAFPELAELTGDDFQWVRRLWEHGLEKEARLLDGLA